MNKFDLMNTVLVSDLNKEAKLLLQELILRMDEHGVCWPSVERLCKVLGIKHEKNFKGVDHYLPAGLVTKEKRGRKNTYTINTPALEGVSEAEVMIKHTNTPSLAGVNTPSAADNTPAVADNTPSVAGANSTDNTTKETTRDNTYGASAPVDSSLIKNEDVPSTILSLNPSFEEIVSPLLEDSRFSLLDPTPTDAATPSPFSNHLLNEIKEQVAAIASDEEWDGEFTENVLALTLDPSFEEGNIGAGSRIARAKQTLKVTENVW